MSHNGNGSAYGRTPLVINQGAKSSLQRSRPTPASMAQVRPRPAGRISETQETEHTSPHCSPSCTGMWGATPPQRYGQAPNDGVELQLGCRASSPAGPIRKRPEPKASGVPHPLRGRGWPQAANCNPRAYPGKNCAALQRGTELRMI